MARYILVVDDQEDARTILEKIVTALGLNCKTACDGREAYEQIKNEPPALVLLDLMMPGMDGFTLLSKLRSVPNLRQIPVVVVSAYHLGQQDMLRLPGIAGVYHKDGFKVSEVQALLQEFVN